ncbi:maleate cis-trans isomerase [Aquabacter spiritensis]|uniref:Maleate isomerase/arylmalonate decarboxylase n=1 Tax=Aquabacter spiritensis TaxID=933073 RepID=A0A4V6NZL1_9HYPH|nr:maleate cis-trans isomerase [Aquabacter spiritensis]TCT06778.1 maleate isomerase/arylmalonate decarboxylase [Aquabacter spiritensis]
MYGWRGRIGLLVPSINNTMEPEFWRIAPEGVSISTARIAGGRHGTPEELRGMEKESRAAAARVANTEPGVVVYGCTSGSFFEGPGWNRMICEELTKITGAPTVTTAGAMAECLMQNGHTKVDVVTPYVELTNERLKQFLRGFGIEVTNLATFDMIDMFDHAKIRPDEIYRRVKETVTTDSTAVFVACTQLRALEVVDMLERDLGKPVYSANQASAWLAYDALGIDPGITDCGSLLRSLSHDRRAAPRPLRQIA